MGIHTLQLSRNPVAGRSNRQLGWIRLFFFLSGFPALIYQVVWERALFSVYGINIQSVTMVVSAFMLGLGLGSLVGGVVSRSRRFPLAALFATGELGTAIFGVISLNLFHRIAEITLSSSSISISLIIFSMLLVPTVLMGSTLPLLVEHFVRSGVDLGMSVGDLYFLNTVGSGAACFLASGWLMPRFGQAGSVRAAAAINACVALGAFVYSLRRIQPQTDPAVATAVVDTSDLLLPFCLAVTCAAFCGFAALSYEIVWYRILAFALMDTAAAFASLLGAYLFGLALGSRFIERYCENHQGKAAIWKLGQILFVSGLIAFLVVPMSALLLKFASPLNNRGNWPMNLGLFIFVSIAAGFFGATFPLVSHVSIPRIAPAGSSLSYLYAANIAGATAGTLLVGLILMDHFSLLQISAGLLSGSVLLAGWVWHRSGESRAPKRFAVALAACVAIVAAMRPIFPALYSRLLFKNHFPVWHFQQVVENRSGVVGATRGGTVYGGGVYDGRFNIDLLHDVNMIFRPYSLSAFHADPQRVLMIGLGSGSWGQVLVHHPQVKDLTVVEINPGYLELIPQHRDVASLLENKKCHIIIDDGRRWLFRNPQQMFDAVVINNSFYWRNHSSNLLSVEFLQLVRRHLLPKGVLLYNTTNSDDVIATALSVFPYGIRVLNAMAVSDAEVAFDRIRLKSVLLDYEIDGRKIIDAADPRQVQALEGIVNIQAGPPGKDWHSIEDNQQLRTRLHGRIIITDDNMGLEWR